jgi:hypothetical protein
MHNSAGGGSGGCSSLDGPDSERLKCSHDRANQPALADLRPVKFSSGVDPLTVSRRWQVPGRATQILSRLRSGVELAEHLVHSVYDCLRLIQLNLVTRSLDQPVYAMRREVREPLLQGNPNL